MSPLEVVVPSVKDFFSLPLSGATANTVLPATPQSKPSGPMVTDETVAAPGTGTVSQSFCFLATSHANTVPASRVGGVVVSPPAIDVPPYTMPQFAVRPKTDSSWTTLRYFSAVPVFGS